MENALGENNVATKLACLSCRGKKVKCDKSRPCERCVANNIECVYPDMRGQTGPAPGRARVLRKKIKDLKNDIAEQKQRVTLLKQEYQTLFAKMEKSDMRIGGHMVNTNALNTFLHGYLKNGFSFLQVTPPLENINDYYSNSKNGTKSILMSTIFGVGALLIGDKINASKFVKSIETSIQDSFDDVHPNLCGTYLILSGLFASLGDCKKEEAYNNRALAMANILQKRSENRPGVIDVSRVARCCHITKTIYKENTDELSQLIVAMAPNDYDAMSWVSVHSDIWVLQRAIRAIYEMDPNFVKSSNMRRMHTLLNYTEGVIRKLPDEFKCTLLLRQYASRIVLYMITSEDNEAHKVAQLLLDIMSELDPTLCDSPFFVHTPLVIVGQFYMLFGTYTNEFMKFLRVAARFDTANVVRGLLFNEISRGDVDDMVTSSYFYPRLATYRGLNAQTIALLNNENSINTNNNSSTDQPLRVGGLPINALIE